MTDRGTPQAVPTGRVRARRPIPLVWIVPILTGLIALWLVWRSRTLERQPLLQA